MRQNSTGVGKKRGRRPASGVSEGLRRMHPNAAGIDIGSKFHYVAVPSDRDTAPVRRFGCLTPDLHEMAQWLKACGIETVAMESTGVYWIPVAQVLEQYDLEVLLADAGHVKHVPGRKTDVADCQWLQELHHYGLLRGAFRPERALQVLRTYWRHREGLVQAAAQQIHLMHKALEQMNLQLHKVLSDVTGVSGMRIIRAILQGERDGAALAKMCDWRVKASRETVVKSLTGDYRRDHLFTLRQAVELYDLYHEKIAACDREIQGQMARFAPKADPKDLLPAREGKRPSKRRKNQPHFDLRAEMYRMTGVDLTQIDGISTLTAQTALCECGQDMSAFPSEKHFTSWMGLCPNNQTTGGKVRRTKTRRVQNRLAEALRVAAQSLHHSKSALGAFYRRMKARLGPAKAITATARKLACQVYRLLKYGRDYVDQGEQRYEEQYRERQLRSMKKRVQQLGYTLVSVQTGEVVS
jgi:transposase